MESNYNVAKSAADQLQVISETLCFLSEIVPSESTSDLRLSGVARDGLANILAFLDNKIMEVVEQLDQEARNDKA